MIRPVLISTILFLFPFISNAVDGGYAVSKISPVLLKNAAAVLRLGEERFEIISYTKTRLYKKTAITVLNEQGDDFADFYEFYDKLRSVKSISGRLYDAMGREIRSLKNKEIEDLSAVSEISLMEDNRIKRHNFYYKNYPYTVEYEVTIEYNNTFMLPDWNPQWREKFAVEVSLFTIECPSWFTFRYKMFNYKGEPGIVTNGDKKTFIWRAETIPAVIKEYAAPDFSSITTCVYFSPDKFEIEGYKGGMSSWKELGQFEYLINQGRDKLPPQVKQRVHELTDGITDARKKVKILYEYLQKNTRYVSIQLGFGGWQPFDAAYVASKAYGDCKALSNFMYSLLKEANIKSCYTDIYAGRGETFFIPDFPSLQFNHIILCVPLLGDTMWLECTSQTLPAGYLSGFTSDRYALAVDESGGHLIRTPVYGVNENLQVRKVKASLEDNGILRISANNYYRGIQQDNIHRLITGLSKDKIKEYLHSLFDLGTYEINSFNYVQHNSELPVINESLDITVNNYATMTGKRIFIVPNVMTRLPAKLASDTARKYDLELGLAYKDVDSVEIELPKGYETETVPQDISVQSKFGKYDCSVRLKDNKLIYYRAVEHYSGHFPAKDYNELVKFVETIYKTDRSKVVLVKNEMEKKAF